MCDGNGFTIWLTGPSGAGKSYLAEGLTNRFKELGMAIEVFDGDVVRKQLYPDIGFSKEAREMHNRVVINHARLLTRYGVPNVVSLISPYKAVRDFARQEIGNFMEIYLETPQEVRILRDPKGLYAKAIKGEIANLTGYDGVYEEPTSPDLVLRTHEMTLDQEVEAIFGKARELGFLK